MAPRPARRALTLLDAMTLIGTAAVGLGVYQSLCRGLFPSWFFPPRYHEIVRWNAWTWVAMLSRWASWLIPFAAAWTLVLPLLRARPPRPPWRRVWREPGMAACLAALVGFGWASAGFVLARVLNGVRPGQTSPPDLWWQLYIGEGLFPHLGLAVASVWVYLACAGRWRRRHDAIDGLGRVVGAAWMFIGLVWALRFYFDLL